MEVGVDEAGVGCMFGSMWAAAVVDEECCQTSRDSKKVTPKQREKLRDALLTANVRHGLGETTAREIDALGLGECRRLVFERALDDLVRKHPELVVKHITVDGTIFRPWRDVPYTLVPRADDTVPCVAAASILAKTTRDAQIIRMCEEEPELDDKYAIRSNKGYLATAHVQGLKTWGLTSHHRRTYRVRALE